jgi:hypothetical protein
MDHIGPKNISGISSDSTGNTKLAREIVAKATPWIIILPDVCHLLNNTAKDIGKIVKSRSPSLVPELRLRNSLGFP